MSFTVSPGVAIREIDLTNVVTSASIIEAAFAGKFNWGPVKEPTLITNENYLASRFGVPDDTNAVDFFTAASYLAYSDKLRVVRIGNSDELSTASGTGAAGISILNDEDYDITEGSIASEVMVAKYPGDLGNSLGFAICTSSDEFEYTLPGTFSVTRGSKVVTYNQAIDLTVADSSGFEVGETVTGGTSAATGVVESIPNATTVVVNSVVGTFVAETITGGTSAEDEAVTSVDAQTIDLSDYFNVADFLVINSARYIVDAVTASTINLTIFYGGDDANAIGSRLWQYARFFAVAPKTDKAHVVILDIDGKFTNEPGFVLETYGDLSNVPGEKYSDGSAAFIADAINRRSAYVRAGGQLTNGALPVNLATINSDLYVSTVQLSGGVSGNDSLVTGDYLVGYDLFSNSEQYEVPLIIAPASDSAAIIPNYIIQNIAEVRRDTVVFTSPRFSDVVNNVGNEVNDTKLFRSLLPSSSYAALDSGWKYMYDKYNDVFRWVPIAGDSAGIAARTETDREAWYAPAGFSRGIVKNVVRLSHSPNQGERDDLFAAGINPVSDFIGRGTVLFGDKTLLSEVSAFDAIGVRRLFIILEKAIARFAQNSLFELNDAFTRGQFVSAIEPFLRDIKGRRGIQDFLVKADDEVNTPQVVDEGKFVGQIFLKPTRSIRFIRLDFVGVRSGVSFEEVVGSV